MAEYTLPGGLRPGERSADTSLLASLGTVVEVPSTSGLGYGKFVLCRSLSTVASPGGLCYLTSLSSNVPTFVVAATASNNSHLNMGIALASQAALTANDFFWLQIGGVITGVIADAAIAAVGSLIGSGAVTAGRVTGTTITAGVGAIGVNLQTAAGAGSTFTALLKAGW